MAKGKKIWLSPTGISLMGRCPRCFWLQYKKKIRQPEGISSRLPSRFDGIIKKYFNIYRESGTIPPLVNGKLVGKLENPFTETYFYHHDDKYGYFGKLDECLITPDSTYSPIDHKTSSSDPRGRGVFPVYQNQLDSYAWLLEENRKKPSGEGYLIYFYPDETEDMHNGFQMIIHVVRLSTNPQNAKKNFLRAIEILEGPMPNQSEECPFCSWHKIAGEEFGKNNKEEGTENTLF